MSSRKTSHSHPSSKPPFKYFRGELLGKGSYGRVYLGLNAQSGEIMAIKQVELVPSAINRSMSKKQREIIDAFKQESDMLRGLDHEHIVQYLGYEENPESLSIFLEYVPGGTIKTCLNKYGRFRDDVTKSLTIQILSGVEYLHARGIIHRDLKADNILLDKSGICKISDFGISKQVEDIIDVRAYTGMRGTVYWMAPEVVDSKKGGGGYDEKVDIWSVGCVVLEMWSGEQPWKGETFISAILKLSRRQPPPVPSWLRLGTMAEQFRIRCFQRNPSDRPTASELKTHRYLVLPPNWKFPYVMHEYNTHRRSRTKSVTTVRRASFSVDPDAPPVPALRPSMEKPIVHGEPEPPIEKPIVHEEPEPPIEKLMVREEPERSEQTQSPSSSAEAHHTTSTQSVRPSHRNDGPPIVMITPPGSPKQRSFSYDEIELSAKSSDTSEGTGSLRRRKRRLLVVANPDGDGDPDDHKKFVFTPPPLPELDIPKQSKPRPLPPLRQSHLGNSSSSSQVPVKALSGNGPSPPPPDSPSSSSRSASSGSSTGNSRLSLAPSNTRVNHSTNKHETDYSDDSDDDYFLWNKPPADLYKTSNAKKLASLSSPSLAQAFRSPFQSDAHLPNTYTSLAPRRSKKGKARESVRPLDSWLVRPGVQEVKSDLHSFFPLDEVHQVIAQPDASAQSNAGNHANPSVAHRVSSMGGQVEAHLRRMTQMWRNHVGEPKT